jgi:hypothetical protein
VRVAAAAGASAVAFRRRDGGGHLDPKYAQDLLAQSGHHRDDDHTFVDRPRAADDLAEEFGEGFVETATSGEDEGEDVLNQIVPEENGGPFVETTAATEFAHGIDASNPRGAKREPFPKT